VKEGGRRARGESVSLDRTGNAGRAGRGMREAGKEKRVRGRRTIWRECA
jgi:hypothetical protein